MLNNLQGSQGSGPHAGCKDQYRRVLQVQYSCTGESRASSSDLLWRLQQAGATPPKVRQAQCQEQVCMGVPGLQGH